MELNRIQNQHNLDWNGKTTSGERVHDGHLVDNSCAVAESHRDLSELLRAGILYFMSKEMSVRLIKRLLVGAKQTS
jgi:hypothetical protein